MRQHLLVSLTLALGIAAAGCGSSGTATAVSFSDDLGRAIHLSRPATRIVTLGPSNSEILLALGLKKDIVGVDSESLRYLPPPYAGHLGGIPVVGSSYSGLNVEKIAGLKPNLILAIAGTADMKEIEALKIPVAVLNPDSLAGVYRDIELVGAATGHAAGARAQVAQMRATVRKVVRAVAGTTSRPTVFLELGASPYYTAGPGSFIDALLRLAGGRNVVDRISKQPWPALSSEAVIAADPQAIILGDSPYATAAQVARRPGWGVIAAVRDHDVYGSINPDYFAQPSPAIVIGLEEIAKVLHPGIVIH